MHVRRRQLVGRHLFDPSPWEESESDLSSKKEGSLPKPYSKTGKETRRREKEGEGDHSTTKDADSPPKGFLVQKVVEEGTNPSRR